MYTSITNSVQTFSVLAPHSINTHFNNISKVDWFSNSCCYIGISWCCWDTDLEKIVSCFQIPSDTTFVYVNQIKMFKLNHAKKNQMVNIDISVF